MSYGGYHPFPKRFGGNRYSGKPLTRVIHESLNAQRGPAFQTDEGNTIVSLENLAFARALACDGWETNARVALQWDPARTTDMLERWERIFRILPAPDATDASRRAELVLRWQRFGGISNHARMTTALASALGSFFVALEYISLAIANVHVPAASPAYPWGTVVDGVTWSSTVAHFLVRLQVPTGATEGDFYEVAGKVPLILDPIMSAFATLDWYRPGPISVLVPGGPSAAGFYLDDAHNLDNEIFDNVLDPGSLNLSGWYRAPFAASPWLPTSSAGISGSQNSLTEATNPPAAGAALNGRTAASFDGVNDILATTGNLLSTFIGTTAWSLSVLINPTATAAVRTVGGGYNDPAIIAETTQGYWYLTYTTSGVTVGHYDSVAATWKEANMACSSGTWHLVQAWFDGANINISVDGVAGTPTASTNQALGGVGILTLGQSFGGTRFTGLIAEVMVSLVDLGASARSGIKEYTNDRHALTL